MSWFTVDEINEKTYAISEYKHWEQVHSYLLIGNEFALLIDTGIGIASLKKEVNKLTDLPIRVVATHIHWDHIGNHHEFEYIYVHKDEYKWITKGIGVPLNAVKQMVVKDVTELPIGFNINKYKVFSGKPNKVLEHQDLIDLGDREIEVIHTPGHSPGHMCFYDKEYKLLFTGDLIYKGTLYAFYPTTDPVKFKESVAKLLKYDVTKLLPAHNQLNIDVSLITEIYKAFCNIEKQNKLKQGEGIFEFENFKIHI